MRNQPGEYDIPNSTPIIATRVPETQRLNFLPKHFGRHMLTLERTVYAHMRELCANYTGGLWNFYDLSNGGAYLAPDESESMQIAVHMNGYVGTMSADAAGITVTLFALSHLSFQFSDIECFAEHFHQLREFALNHAEAAGIFAAID